MGYFGIRSEFKVKKVFQIETQVIFYSLLGLFVALLFRREMGFEKVVMTFFPIVFNQYWFITAYLMVYILSPFLNRLLLELDEVLFRRLITIFIVFWSIIPFFSLREKTGLFWNQFIWFIVMYAIGGYLRLNKNIFSEKIYWITLLTCSTMLISSVVLANLLQKYFPILEGHTTYAGWSNSPLIICVSLSMIRLVECRPIGHKKWINYLSAGTLGIYLFHENVYISDILWNYLFNNSGYIGSYAIVVHIIVAVVFVFSTGSTIDIFRRFLFKKSEIALSSVSDRIEMMLKKSEQKINKIFSNGS